MAKAPYISPVEVVSGAKALELAEGRVYDCDRKMFAGAIYVLARLFGHEWVQTRIAEPVGPAKTFMRSPILKPSDKVKAGHRVIDLAEHLVNLQEIQGFDSCLAEVRRDNIEAAHSKLIAAGMLRRRNIPFRFVVPAGRLGHDYDAEAIIGATVVPIEMKAKVESTASSMHSVVNSLKVARKQFPKDTPNLGVHGRPGGLG